MSSKCQHWQYSLYIISFVFSTALYNWQSLPISLIYKWKHCCRCLLLPKRPRQSQGVKPFYSAHDSMGQTLGQGTAGVPCLSFKVSRPRRRLKLLEAGIIKRFLSWGEPWLDAAGTVYQRHLHVAFPCGWGPWWQLDSTHLASDSCDVPSTLFSVSTRRVCINLEIRL